MVGAPGSDCFIQMESVLDMLKVLDYENKFVKQKGFKPLSRVYFAQQQQGDEQFLHFVTLVSWLLALNNHQTSGWNKYDNPMNSAQNVIAEIRKLGVPIDLSPNKLLPGFGEGVC